MGKLKYKTIKIITDILMTVLMFVLMGIHLTGQMLHEISGTACFVLFVLHHILNRRWIAGISKGKYPAFRVMQTIINTALFIGVILLMFSGMAMSGYVFKWLPLPLSNSTARSLHLIISYAVFLVMSMHIGLHFGLIIGKAGKYVLEMKKPWRGMISWASRIVALFFAGYGLMALFSRKLLTYIFGDVKFAFFDYNESVISFYFDYAAIMGLCIFIVYYIYKFLQPGFFKRISLIVQWMADNKIKAVILGAVIVSIVILATYYGASYISRHYFPVKLNRDEAIGNDELDMGTRNGIIISFTRVGNTNFDPNVDAVSSASLMDEDGSLVGNAELLSDMAEQITGFARYEIVVEKKYSSSYGATVSEARTEMNNGFVPTFVGEQPDLSKYDTVILVYPLWWWTLPVPVEEYMKLTDMEGKDIYCIVTHGGSGLGSSISDLKEVTNGTVSDNTLAVMDKDVTYAFQNVLNWIREWNLNYE